MGAGHDHSVGTSATRARRLGIAIALNVGIVVVQVAAGIWAGSLGLIADAAHNLTDVLALVVSLVAVRFARRPATAARSFGWHRATILAALFNAAPAVRGAAGAKARIASAVSAKPASSSLVSASWSPLRAAGTHVSSASKID